MICFSLGGQRLLGGIRRRHHIVILRREPIPDCAVCDRSRLDGLRAIERAIGAFRPVRLIQAKLRLSIMFVRTVTVKTPVREDRTDVPVETNRLLRHADNGQGQDAGRNET